jgi:MFS family permease
MLSTFDVSHYLNYPFKGPQAQKKFLIGSLLTLAGFIIPILPFLILYGYLAQIVQKVLDGEDASMPAWDDWEKLLKDGLRFYGVRMVFALPILILIFGVLIVYLAGFFFVMSQDRPSTALMAALILVLFGAICLMIPLGFIISILAYPAGIHAVSRKSFLAGFSVGEWWPILRKNIGGFLLAIATLYVVSFLTNLIIQLLYITVILACLVPILMPAVVFYMLLVVEPMAAQAYREGREKLNLPASIVQESSQ